MTDLGTTSKLAWLMQVILLVVVKPRRKETWWWNNVVDCAIKEKRRLWKEWQKGGDIEKYLQAKNKKKAKSAFYEKGKAHKKSDLVILKAMIKDDDGNLAFGDK